MPDFGGDDISILKRRKLMPGHVAYILMRIFALLAIAIFPQYRGDEYRASTAFTKYIISQPKFG